LATGSPDTGTIKRHLFHIKVVIHT